MTDKLAALKSKAGKGKPQQRLANGSEHHEALQLKGVNGQTGKKHTAAVAPLKQAKKVVKEEEEDDEDDEFSEGDDFEDFDEDLMNQLGGEGADDDDLSGNDSEEGDLAEEVIEEPQTKKRK